MDLLSNVFGQKIFINTFSRLLCWVKRLTQAAWAEAEFQIGQRDFAAILDFHSVWYRNDLVQPRLKLEQLYFGLTGPNICTYVIRNFKILSCA